LHEVEVDQCDVIFKSLESVINLDVNVSELKYSPYSSFVKSSFESSLTFVAFYKMVNRVNESKIVVK